MGFLHSPSTGGDTVKCIFTMAGKESRELTAVSAERGGGEQ